MDFADPSQALLLKLILQHFPVASDDELSRCVGKKDIVILRKASWHTSITPVMSAVKCSSSIVAEMRW